MKRLCLIAAAVCGLAFSLVGCTRAPSAPSAGSNVDPKQAATLTKLSDEDRMSATAQGYCAVMTSEPLGSMGVPLKLTIKDQTIWVCCKGCEKKALANPDQTLAKVAELKAQVISDQSR